MKPRYIVSPQAARDLAAIWRHIRERTSQRAADRVESVIRQKFTYLSHTPEGGHWRKDLTDEYVKFLPVYSYLIIYRPQSKPVEIVAILHGHRDVERLLRER